MENRYLMVDFVPQAYHSKFLESVKTMKFTEILNDPRALMASVWQMVAIGTNRTLIAADHQHYLDNDTYPKMMPILGQYAPVPRTIFHVWNYYYNQSKTTATSIFVSTPAEEWNFVYCATPIRKQDSIWGYDILTDPFDYHIWLYLILALTLTSTVVCTNASKYFSTLFSNFAFILGQGAIADASSVQQYSLVFVLWTQLCCFLINLYSGEITSVIIQPLPEITIESIDELERKNYSLIYENPIWVVNTNRIVQDGGYVPPDRLTFSKLISKGVKLFPDLKEYFTEMSKVENKVATMMLWMYAISAFMGITKQISADPRQSKRRGKCYIGSKLMSPGYTVYGFTPPSNIEASMIFQRTVLETGLYKYLMGELYAREHSERVQDRVKVISRSKVLDEQTEKEKVVVLTLHGKIRIMFMLWAILCTLSFVSFATEKNQCT